ncbi:MAG: 16S rRNA (cytosine(967)-C(5))-methyltransferase RsmB, partial [Burkholderiales bacterium]|nr:16S rRNA (cytosine(967)-C(5))-methyltransferase RsmB [Burkholderiales bacterium]
TALHASVAQDPVAQWNHPLWWIAQLQADHPLHWQDILAANNTKAPLVLRINERNTSVASVFASLSATDLVANTIPPQGLQLSRGVAVGQLPGYAQGHFSVQDAAAQQAAPLLLSGLADQGRAWRILDACAAPGGKTAHLLELADCEVTALDIDPVRCQRIHENLARLGLRARVIVADAATPDAWWPSQCQSQPFDAILLDAPCTASGIVRRHPDVRWLRRGDDVDALARIQSEILESLWPLLRRGGRLLYATCSIFQTEGRQQIDAFLQRLGPDAALLEPQSPGHILPLPDNGTPGSGGRSAMLQDGFFYALIRKN